MALYLATSNVTASTALTTNNVWYSWCDGTGTSAAGATTAITAITTGNCWQTWTTSDATSNGNAIWINWTAVNLTGLAGTTAVSVGGVAKPYVDPRTPEQKAAAADAAQLVEQQRHADQRRKAIACARALLLAMLDQQQREQLQRDRFFEVIAKHSKRRYRIRQGTHGNVKLLDDQGREVVSYCGQPPGVPEDDAMLAQKLQIEHDEGEYLKRANATRVA